MKRVPGNALSLTATFLGLLILGTAFLVVPRFRPNPAPDDSTLALLSDPYPALQTATIVQPPTVSPGTPVPPDLWPTEAAWPPPTSSAAPFLPPEVIPFPTLEIQFLDEVVPNELLYHFWYASRPGKNAPVHLEGLLIDERGMRKEQPAAVIPLGFGASAETPRLVSLHGSALGSYLAYQGAEREGAVWAIVDKTNADQIPAKETFGFHLVNFYRWSPDGQEFLAQTELNGSADASLVNASSVEQARFVLPDQDGISPAIQDMAFTADGREIAAVSVYQPYSEKNKDWMTVINLWNGKDPAAREVLCRVMGGKGAEPSTLRWSPNGEKLLWVGGRETAGSNGWENWLWLADLNAKTCVPLIKMGLAPEQGWWVSGGFSADWSPDGTRIVYRVKEETRQGSLYSIRVMDLAVSSDRLVFGPTSEILSSVQFSPGGDLVVFEKSKADYGEIYGLMLDSGDTFPIAGPTSIYSAFIWEKQPHTPDADQP